MPKLKLGPVLDERPVKLALELPAAVHRDLVAYAAALARETGETIEPVRLIAPMLARFMATDRGFARARRAGKGARSERSAGERSSTTGSAESI